MKKKCKWNEQPKPKGENNEKKMKKTMKKNENKMKRKKFQETCIFPSKFSFYFHFIFIIFSFFFKNSKKLGKNDENEETWKKMTIKWK